MHILCNIWLNQPRRGVQRIKVGAPLERFLIFINEWKHIQVKPREMYMRVGDIELRMT